MPEYAPGFDGASGSVIPKPTNPLVNRLVANGLVASTIGAAAGGATSVTKSRIKAPTIPKEHKPDIEAEALINRNSTAADVTAMKTRFTEKKPSFAFVRDLSGNGGAAYTRT